MTRRGLAGLSLGLGLLHASPLAASQAQVHVAEGRDALLRGTFDGASLTPDGRVTAGPSVRVLAEALGGAVLALARGEDGALYAATASPARVWRIVAGKDPEKIHEEDKPLITALVPLGKGTLAALTAPDGGAVLIDLASKKSSSVPAKDAKLLLAGAAVDETLYAVGGGEQGVVLRLGPGAKAFEVIARTQEAQLRSIALGPGKAEPRIVVGGGEQGVVYEVMSGRVRALLDATPAEVTSVVLAPDGTVFAAMVDGDGKLSKSATPRAREESPDDKKVKARKVRGGEVWRIDTTGRARILWQSREHGAYALALAEIPDAAGKQAPALLAGTGPEGRVLQLDPKGAQPAGVLVRVKDHDEVTSLRADASGLVLGTAHGPAVLATQATRAASGTWTSEILDAESLARFGTAALRGRGDIRLSVRTGNTRDADDTWSEWQRSPSDAPLGRYAQVRAVVSQGAALEGVSLSYLVNNRPPEIARVEVLAPGWKVVANVRDATETRSVTFGERPFVRFLERRGGQNPTLEERPFGKQNYNQGWRTVYAYAEDPDKDALRYRFYLGRVTADGAVQTWTVVKDWSEEPFLSFEASRLADGEYRVKVEVDDLATNGPARRLSHAEVSAPFVVSHALPRISNASATRTRGSGVRVRLDAQAAQPLSVVRCSASGADWVPLDPRDGIVDTASESFDAVLDLGARAGALQAVSCEIYDEALNFNRVDVPVTPGAG